MHVIKYNLLSQHNIMYNYVFRTYHLALDKQSLSSFLRKESSSIPSSPQQPIALCVRLCPPVLVPIHFCKSSGVILFWSHLGSQDGESIWGSLLLFIHSRENVWVQFRRHNLTAHSLILWTLQYSWPLYSIPDALYSISESLYSIPESLYSILNLKGRAFCRCFHWVWNTQHWIWLVVVFL